MKYNVLFFAAVILFLSSCSYKTRDILFKTDKTVDQEKINPVLVINNKPSELTPNIIEVDDILSVNNLQNPDLISGVSSSSSASGAQGQASAGYRVLPDSTVLLPVLGKVNLAGLTILEAQNKLNDLYRKEFLKAPIITVSISNMKVMLLGEVGSPGSYALTKERTALTELLSQAGGLTNRANKGAVRIIRGNPADPEIIYANLRDIKALASPELYLRKNDIVYVEPNGSAQATDRFARISSVAQIGLFFLNTALLIFTLTK